MSSIPLLSDAEIPAPLAQRLEGLPHLNIHRLLTWVPEVFGPWLDFVGGIYHTEFDPRLREIAICRYGAITHARYELFQHTALAKKNEVSEADLAVILDPAPVDSLDPDANLVCAVVDEFEKTAALSEATRTRLLEKYGPHKTMILLVTLGHYSCVCRVLNAANLPTEARSPLEDAGSPLG